MRWFRYIVIGILATLVWSCTDIVVKVGKKEKSSNLDALPAAEDSTPITIRDAEFYLQNLDDLRNKSSDSIVRRIQQNWRHLFRREFRAMRDALVAAGERQHEYYDGVIFDLKTEEECGELDRGDFQSFDGFKKMGSFLEGSFIANLSVEQARKISPDLASVLEVTTNIILFELGMQASGWSEIETVGDNEIFRTHILWKVDPEIEDLPEEMVNDHIGVSLAMERISKGGIPKSVQITLRAGGGVFENAPTGPQYKLTVNSEWGTGYLGGIQFTNSVQITKDDQATYSRQFLIEQAGRFSPSYIFRDTIHFGLPEEKSRQVIIDFAALEKCVMEKAKVMVPGVIEMDQTKAESTLQAYSFEMSIVDDRTGGDPTAVVAAQDPKAGEMAPAKSVVRVILDFPAEDMFGQPASTDPPPPSTEGS